MPIQKRNEFKVLSIEEIANLSDYKRYKYYTQLEAREKRKNKTGFNKYLEESCKRYDTDR